MGNEHLIYYVCIIILGVMLIIFGSWTNQKIESTDTSLDLAIRGMLVTGTVLLTAGIGFIVCAFYCVGKNSEMSISTTFLMGTATLTGAVFSASTLVKYRKQYKHKASQSLSIWMGITMVLSIVFSIVSWMYMINKMREKREPLELKKRSLSIRQKERNIRKERKRQERLAEKRALERKRREQLENEEKTINSPESILKRKRQAERKAEETLKKENKQFLERQLAGILSDIDYVDNYKVRRGRIQDTRYAKLRDEYDVTGKDQLLDALNRDKNDTEQALRQIGGSDRRGPVFGGFRSGNLWDTAEEVDDY